MTIHKGEGTVRERIEAAVALTDEIHKHKRTWGLSNGYIKNTEARGKLVAMVKERDALVRQIEGLSGNEANERKYGEMSALKETRWSLDATRTMEGLRKIVDEFTKAEVPPDAFVTIGETTEGLIVTASRIDDAGDDRLLMADDHP